MQTAAEAGAAAVCSGHYRTRIIYHIMQSFIQTQRAPVKGAALSSADDMLRPTNL